MPGAVGVGDSGAIGSAGVYPDPCDGWCLYFTDERRQVGGGGEGPPVVDALPVGLLVTVSAMLPHAEYVLRRFRVASVRGRPSSRAVASGACCGARSLRVYVQREGDDPSVSVESSGGASFEIHGSAAPAAEWRALGVAEW